jgi:integrase
VSVDRLAVARAAAARPRGEGPIAAGLDAAAVMALVDPAFLAEAGWDPVTMALSPPADHPLLGRPVCRAGGCDNTAHRPSRICMGCEQRLAEHGLSEDALAALPPLRRVKPDTCAVSGCARVWASGRSRLCQAHLHQQRKTFNLPLEQFLADRRVQGLPACGPCLVSACMLQRRAPSASYCNAHQQRWWKARQADPGIDEGRWRAQESASTRPGQTSLRGLHPLVVAQLLLGISERTRTGRKHFDEHLRYAVNEIRRQQIASISEVDTNLFTAKPQASLVRSIADHLRRFFVDAETEKDKDVWDLTAFGDSGRAWFTSISQRWLREAAKRWAVDDLPRRRGAKIGHELRSRIRCLSRLSASLRLRADRGEAPAALGRTDMDNFCNRLAFQQAQGQLSADARRRTCLEVRTVLNRVRAMGLTRPGQVAAGLGEDFVLTQHDVPRPVEREPSRDLPAEIVAALCGRLPELEALFGAQTRAAVELLIDTGRRPGEICQLGFDCLVRDGDGKPVLVYDNDKSARKARRLPIGEATADVIVAQQQRVRAWHPNTPIAELKLLPARRHNPHGRDAIGVGHLARCHGQWAAALPVLRTTDGVEFDTARIMPYAWRHTFAQRHADAGVGVDVLHELMDHRVMDTTKRYYRVGEQRRREAVDRLVALQFDRHGNRIWRDAKALLDSEHVRRAVGEVVVPFGVCAEPSNVKAGGHACPYRFRCVGCDHFRTDASYLPDLHAYLDDLLRNSERLRAAVDIDDWARAEATPSDAEITQVRRLIARIGGDLDALTPAERGQVEQAVATVRRHRAVALGMPKVRPPQPDIRLERAA